MIRPLLLILCIMGFSACKSLEDYQLKKSLRDADKTALLMNSIEAVQNDKTGIYTLTYKLSNSEMHDFVSHSDWILPSDRSSKSQFDITESLAKSQGIRPSAKAVSIVDLKHNTLFFQNTGDNIYFIYALFNPLLPLYLHKSATPHIGLTRRCS